MPRGARHSQFGRVDYPAVSRMDPLSAMCSRRIRDDARSGNRTAMVPATMRRDRGRGASSCYPYGVSRGEFDHRRRTSRSAEARYLFGGRREPSRISTTSSTAARRTLPPAELLANYRAAKVIDPRSRLLGPRFNFAQHGQRRAWFRNCCRPAGIVDDVDRVEACRRTY